MRPHDGRAIPTFIRQALNGEPITVTSDGGQTRSICYVEDTIEGVLALAGSDFQGPVNIGNPTETSMLHLAQTIRDLAGSTSPIHFIDRPIDDPAVRRPDTTLAARRLGCRHAGADVPYLDLRGLTGAQIRRQRDGNAAGMTAMSYHGSPVGPC